MRISTVEYRPIIAAMMLEPRARTANAPVARAAAALRWIGAARWAARAAL